MKRVWVCVFLCLSVWVVAQEPVDVVRIETQLEWDAAPTEIWIDVDGDGVGDLADLDGGGVANDPIMEPVLSVQYDVAYSLAPVTDRTSPADLVSVVSVPVVIITVPQITGQQAWAVRARYTTASGVSTSRWAWSDRPEDTNDSPFFLVFPGTSPAPRPRDLRTSPM